MFDTKFSFLYRPYKVITLKRWYAEISYIVLYENDYEYFCVELSKYVNNTLTVFNTTVLNKNDSYDIKNSEPFVDDRRLLAIYDKVNDVKTFNDLTITLINALSRLRKKESLSNIRYKESLSEIKNIMLTKKDKVKLKRIKEQKIEREAKLMQTQKYKKF
jgi:hypothetical protein